MNLRNRRVRLIDAHAHLLPAKRMESLLRWARRVMPDHPVSPDISLEEVFAEYDQIGVELVFNMAYPIFEHTTEDLNRFNFDLARRFAPRVLPIGSLHIEDEDKRAIVDTCILTYKFLGLKFHPFIQRFDPWDERMFPVYERMSELRKPVFMHTGFEKFYQGNMPVKKLEHDILRRFPDLPVIFTHALFPYFEEAFRLLDAFPQLHLDIANVYGSFGDERYGVLRGSREEQIFYDGLNVWHRRIMFGSDHPAGIGTLTGIYQDHEALPVAGEARENIFGGTALRLVETYHGPWAPGNGSAPGAE